MPRPVKGNIHNDPRSGKAVVVPAHTDKRAPARPRAPKLDTDALAALMQQHGLNTHEELVAWLAKQPTSPRPRTLRVDTGAVDAVIGEAKAKTAPAKRATTARKPRAKAPEKPKKLGVLVMRRLNKVLETGRAKIEKEGRKYAAFTKKGDNTRYTKKGTFNTLADAQRFLVDDFKLTEAGAGRGYTDVGVKAGGARKDAQEARQAFMDAPSLTSFEALEKVDAAEAAKHAKKTHLWPTPKVSDLEATGKTGDWACATLIVHSLIPPEPRRDKSQQGRLAYAYAIQHLRNICEQAESGQEIFDSVRSLFSPFTQHGRDRMLNIDTDYHGRKVSQAVFDRYPGQKLEGAEGEKQKLNQAFSNVDINRLYAFVHNQTRIGGKYGSTRLDFENYLFPDGRPDWDELHRQYDRAVPTGGGEKAAGPKKELTEAEQMRLWERTVPSVYERVGGRKATARRPQDFLTQFGLAGSEYGNWVDDKKGREHSERAAEAFQDLADALGIPDKDIGLFGRLILSFGARGHAGAAGHYEPNNVLISLTRDRGIGSLAHEWGHFLDHTIQRLVKGDTARPDRRKGGREGHVVASVLSFASEAVTYAKEGRDSSGRDITGDPVLMQLQKVMHTVVGGPPMRTFTPNPARYTLDDYDSRREVVVRAAWGDARKAFRTYLDTPNYAKSPEQAQMWLDYIAARTGWKGDVDVDMSKWPGRESQFFTHMKTLDARKGSKKYWTKPEEMFARALEATVADTLAAKRRSNNYLVRNEKISGTISPLPQDPDERKAIAKEMLELFRVIKRQGTLRKATDFLSVLEKALS